MSFECQVDSAAEVEWTLNEELLEQNEFIKFKSKEDGTHVLVLEDVTVEFEGSYGISASNSAGAISCMAQLLVQGIDMFRNNKLALNLSVFHALSI